jgi:hypothetical protein
LIGSFFRELYLLGIKMKLILIVGDNAGENSFDLEGANTPLQCLKLRLIFINA